jgi:hypothetical protein
MRKLAILLQLLLMLTACGKTAAQKNADAFFDPLRTYDELNSMQEIYDPQTLSNRYTFTYTELKMSQPSGMCWFNGRLHLSDDRDMRVAALGKDGTLETVYLSDVRSPLALTSSADGSLYVGHGGNNSSRGKQYSLTVFDQGYNVISGTDFTINGDPDTIRPNSLAVTSSGVYLTLQSNINGEEGVIYKIEPDGKVSSVGGNNSFGNLSAIPDGFVFVNDRFTHIYNPDTRTSMSQPGLSAIYKFTGDTVTDSVAIPPNISFGDSAYLSANSGIGGISYYGEQILIADQFTKMILAFDQELNYLWAQQIAYDKQSDTQTDAGSTLLCQFFTIDPDTGNLYISGSDSMSGKFGLVMGTP